MEFLSADKIIKKPQRAFHYGWVIVICSTLQIISGAGAMYTFGIFFKPIANELVVSRAALSGAYSLFMFNCGFFSMVCGYLCDKYGPAKTGMAAGFLLGLGLILSSQVNSLWQFYVTYGLISGIGMGGGFSIGMGTTARWFEKRRGLALGIVASGAGIGMLIYMPVSESLIASYHWDGAYLVLGFIILTVVVTSAAFLRSSPAKVGLKPYGYEEQVSPQIIIEKPVSSGQDFSIFTAIRTRFMLLLVSIYLLFAIGQQMVTVHLVNYATDTGILTIMAASLMSVVGIGGIIGRTSMGAISDKIGAKNALLACCATMTLALIMLIFTRELWMFFLFAIIFGFAAGGEIPQMPILVGEFFGMKAVSGLVGVIVFGTCVGAALGSWAGGRLFDISQNYLTAFSLATACSISSVVVILVLKWMSGKRAKN